MCEYKFKKGPSFNAPFKAAVEREATKHLQENLSSYMEERINASR